MNSDRRIPSLDGLRGVSALLVVVAHMTTATPMPFIWRIDFGNLGVRIFFVISGFIITKLLLDERARRGTISLKAFYVRRFFRIMPACYALIAAVGLLGALHLTQVRSDQLVAAFFYFSNYHDMVGSPLNQTWSLGVEEQFYLAWPGLLVLLGLRRSLFGCFVVLLAAPSFRLLSDAGLWPTNPWRAFESVSDALAIGCVLAIIRERLWAFAPYRNLLSCSWLIAIPIAGVAFMAHRHSGVILDFIGIPVLNLGIALMLDRWMRFAGSLTGRFLNLSVMVWIGSISYSIYLWHPVILGSNLALPVKLPSVIVCATLSYYLIERPCLAIRQRFLAKSARPESGPLTPARRESAS